jgi:hypothetical protein
MFRIEEISKDIILAEVIRPSEKMKNKCFSGANHLQIVGSGKFAIST